MKKYLITLLFLASFDIFSLEVNRDFIEIDLDLTVEFENYVGPYLFYNSIEEIRDIGTYLADDITVDRKSDANYSGKYIMSHRLKLEWEEVINSCDVFQITSDAFIDNINNIELIISQYLIDNYGYSLNDADLLAHLLAVYNAVIRGDVKHIGEHYTSEGVLTDNNNYLGLDLQYSNWPGKTFIYIPLSNDIQLGRLSTINSDILTEDIVIESIKLNDEEDIKFREDIVEFKEREFDEISEDISTIEEEILILSESEDNIEIIEEKQEQLTIKKEVIEDKEEIILELRDDLSEDKNNLIIKKEKSTTSASFPFLINKLVDSTRFGQLVNIMSDGTVSNRGRVNSIRNNTFFTSGDYTYVLAGGDGANQIITLGRISTDTLTILNWSEIPCYEKSPILIKGKNIYSIIVIDSNYYIGEFDLELNLLRRSETNIVKESSLILKSDTFYIQGNYNSIKLVNLSDFISVSD